MRKFVTFILLFSLFACIFASKKQNPDVQLLELNSNWQFKKCSDSVWLPASVPGCVHTDLLANKLIDDPYYRYNEKRLQWIDKTDWEYKTTFAVSTQAIKSQTLELIFKGLDTYADVYVNDSLVLSANNMFREWIIPVTFRMKEGTNILRILFKSPINEGIRLYDANPAQLPASNDYSEIGQVEGNKKVSPYIRKASYNFGWDWGPRLVSSGVWRQVYLRTWNKSIINDLQIVQDSLSATLAKLTAKVEVMAVDTQTIKLELTDLVKAGVKTKGTFKLEKGVNVLSLSFDIDKPKLWWSNGLGEAYVYKFKATIADTKQLIDTKEISTGLRTIKLVQKPDSAGHSFYFVLNGVPVFAKGANYIPNDLFINRVTPDKYEHIIKSAHDANMNMLRLWGGGIYENDIFYDLCDKYGIMIWHDFMFSCCLYPADSTFMANVKVEFVQNIKHIRNHPSIALWSGNNEIFGGLAFWGWKDKFVGKQQEAIINDYNRIFHEALPEILKQYDPQRPYIPSSPFGGYTKNPDGTSAIIPISEKSGDFHEWSVWHGKNKFNYYNDHTPRFCSEYGFQSFPDINTIKTFAIPSDYDINSPVMKWHQRSGPGNMLIKIYMDYDYKTPKDFVSFLYVGQVLQAEGMKVAMESHRRHMPYCMGSLYWQINDCWQAPSWSSIDYLGHWKAAQYQAKRSYSEVLVSPMIEKQMLNIYVVSDRLSDVNATLDMKIIDFEGKQLWQQSKEVTVKHNESKIEYSVPFAEVATKYDTTSVILSVVLKNSEGVLSANTITLCAPKDLKLPKIVINTNVNKKNGKYQITLSTDKLAKNVYLNCISEGHFSDNFFDLLPGEAVTVTFYPKDAISDFEKELKVISLIDTY